MTNRTQAMDFTSTLPHPESPLRENLRIGAIAGAITHDGADLIIEHLNDYLSTRNQQTKDAAARCLAEAMADLIADNVGQWEEFSEWLAESVRPCAMTQFKTKRDAAY